MKEFLTCLCAAALLAGCGGREPGSAQLTKGSFRLGCDEAIQPVMEKEAGEFMRLYPDAHVVVVPGEAREIIGAFASDSLHTIVCARELNKEERDALAAARVPFQEYQASRTAVAVIENRDVPETRLRVGELDTIFSGGRSRWQGKQRLMIELALSDLNSSVTEVFRKKIFASGGYDRAAKPVSGSRALIDYVRRTPGAIGIVGLNRMTEEDSVTVVAIASPAMRPDSTYAPGDYYTPAQAYVYLEYYPVTAPVYMYTREIDRDISLGFISFVTSAPGQKVFQANGLVPVTMPVRLVHLTSQQVD